MDVRGSHTQTYKKSESGKNVNDNPRFGTECVLRSSYAWRLAW
jgi:hypothetical protein